jgi:1-acyl-sn-glycerol-3-phosphate acyltransferase
MKIPVAGDQVPKRGNAFSRFIGRSVLWILGWRIEGEIPNVPKFVAIAAPHTSNWDFIVGMAAILALGISANWLGKHTIFRRPLAALLRQLGGIPVDRSSHQGIVDQIVKLFHDKAQMILGLSPEGTRGKVDQWKTGFYYIATEAGVPIVLIAFDYSRKVFQIGPAFLPTGDLQKDMECIRAFYSNAKGKYPQLFTLPDPFSS